MTSLMHKGTWRKVSAEKFIEKHVMAGVQFWPFYHQDRPAGRIEYSFLQICHCIFMLCRGRQFGDSDRVQLLTVHLRTGRGNQLRGLRCMIRPLSVHDDLKPQRRA